MNIRRSAAVIALMLSLAGCAITTTVKPVGTAKISDLCIQSNPAVLMEGFLPEMESQIRGHGIKTKVVQPPPPTDCIHHMEYVANWRWDLAMYLWFAELRVYEHNNLIGQAIYDARYGGLRLDKFGSTSEKLRGLIDELFGKSSENKAE